MSNLKLKRIYEPAESGDGFRVLVDRLWPRGISKEEAKLDLWAKEVAPSTELREDFHEEKDTWPEFEKNYKKELHDNPALKELIETIKGKHTTTLLFGSKDTEHNQAIVLADVLKAKL